MISRNHFTVLHALYRHNEQQEPGRHSTGSTQEARQGHIELWEKWSWTGNAVEDVKRAANSLPEKWIVVEKSRIERKFVFDGKAVREIDAKAKHPGNACNVEITSLRVQGQAYWTFGLEAFADPESNEKNLELTVTKVLNDVAAPPELLGQLTAEVSRSYPAWVATVKLR